MMQKTERWVKKAVEYFNVEHYLTDRELKIIARSLEGENKTVIAKRYGLTPARITSIYDKALRILRELIIEDWMMEKPELLEKVDTK